MDGVDGVDGATYPPGTEGQVLTTVGGEWVPADPTGGGGGGGTYARTTTAITGAGYKETPLAAGYKLLGVQASAPNTRVRLYQTAAGRAADALRPFTQEPTPAVGLVFDALLIDTATLGTNPVVDGFRPAGETQVYLNIQGTAGTVTLTWQRTE